MYCNCAHNRYRRNMDESLRTHERRWLSTGADEDKARFLGYAIRRDAIDPLNLRLAATFGDRAAIMVGGQPLGDSEMLPDSLIYRTDSGKVIDIATFVDSDIEFDAHDLIDDDPEEIWEREERLLGIDERVMQRVRAGDALAIRALLVIREQDPERYRRLARAFMAGPERFSEIRRELDIHDEKVSSGQYNVPNLDDDDDDIRVDFEEPLVDMLLGLGWTERGDEIRLHGGGLQNVVVGTIVNPRDFAAEGYFNVKSEEDSCRAGDLSKEDLDLAGAILDEVGSRSKVLVLDDEVLDNFFNRDATQYDATGVARAESKAVMRKVTQSWVVIDQEAEELIDALKSLGYTIFDRTDIFCLMRKNLDASP